MTSSTRQLMFRRRSLPRRIRASLRDTWVLFREFRAPLATFTITILLGAWSFMTLWNAAGYDAVTYLEAIYDLLLLTFFQSPLEFPQEWYLDLYFFFMPLVGLAVLARGVGNFGTLLFNRSSRQSQWEEAVASTFKNHVIVCGLGHLGIRVVRELIKMNEEIVIIERSETNARISEARGYDIPVVTGDARQPEILEKAKLSRARAIIVCTSDDLANLQMASRIREINQSARIVARMFDDDFARNMAQSFNISAVMSASMLAAPAFAGAATGTEIIQTFKLDDRVMVMGRIRVEPGSKLVGVTVEAIEDQFDLSIILLQSGGKVDVHPEETTSLQPGDMIALVADPVSLQVLATEWNKPRS